MNVTRAASLLLILAVGAAACGSETKRKRHNDDDEDDGSGLSGGDGGSSGNAGAGGTMEDPDGPQFLSLTSSVQTLTDGNTVTFSALMTDPDGVGDVVGGTLKDANGETYGTFTSGGSQGSYSLTIAWSDINNAESIDIDYGAEGSRGFVAEFHDGAGHVSTKGLSLGLACSGGIEACDGACFDTQYDQFNCGSCGHSCSGGDLCVIDAGCEAGQCYADEIDCSELDDECNVGSCDSGTGNCVADPLPNTTTCDDGDDCTSNDLCNSGTCEGTASGATWSDGFEGGSFALGWSGPQTIDWSVTTGTPHAGTFKAKSGLIVGNGTTSLAITRTFASSGSVSFWHSESSESGYDYLSFYIDGIAQSSWSGSNAWTQATYPITAGSHQLEWRYSKDGTVDVGSDAVYIDDVSTVDGGCL